MRRTQLIIIAATAFLGGCYSAQKIKSGTLAFESNKIVAHRGAWKLSGLPENSLASLQHAIDLKCAGSEFDVHRTADDSLVINHDATYFNAVIEKSTYAELAKHKLSNGETLPTLRQFLLTGMRQRSTRLILEIKPSSVSKASGQQTAENVVKLVRELKAAPWIVYISFDYDILKKIVALDPKAETQYLEGNKPPEELMADGITGADYPYPVFRKKPEWIASAKKNKIVLNAWTVNAPADMEWLLSHDFDFITTNEPELLFERLKKK